MSLLKDFERLGLDLVENNDPENHQTGKAWQPDLDNLPEGFEQPGSSDHPNYHPIKYHHSKTGYEVKRPLILVPGILGTSLEVYNDDDNIRITEEKIWPPINLATLRTSPPAGVLYKKMRPNTAGNNPYVPGAYDRLIQFLTEELGYKLDVDLFLFGYNWAKSNKESGQRLAGFIKAIEKSYNWGNWPINDRKVDIINHSMGGIVTRAAINIFGARAKRVIYMASPHYGAPLAYGALHRDLPKVSWFMDFILSFITDLSKYRSLNDELQWIAERMPSSYELLPDDEYFKRDKNIVRVDDFGTDTFPEGFLETFVSNLQSTLQAETQVREARKFKNSLGTKLPGDTYLVLAAQRYTTLNYAEINYPISAGSEMRVEGRLPNGDGTVPLISAKGPDHYTAVVGEHVVLPNLRYTFFYVALFLSKTN